MGSDRPYRPAPEFQRALDDLERLGNPIDRMTRDTVTDLWLLRELIYPDASRRAEPLLADVADTIRAALTA